MKLITEKREQRIEVQPNIKVMQSDAIRKVKPVIIYRSDAEVAAFSVGDGKLLYIVQLNVAL